MSFEKEIIDKVLFVMGEISSYMNFHSEVCSYLYIEEHTKVKVQMDCII